MMRDWSRLRPASFRGVRFYVDSDGPDRGRRVAVHEISGGDRPVTEDMGRAATEFSVDAYVVGDNADALGLALERACDRAGPALLTLPIDAARMVHCTGCSRSREKDRNGILEYSLDFVEAGGFSLAGGDGIAALRSIVSGAAASLIKALVR